MKMFGHTKDNFSLQNPGLIFEVYGQNDKITPEAEKKGSFFDIFVLPKQQIHVN